MKHCASGHCADCTKRRAISRAASIALSKVGLPPLDFWATTIGPGSGPALEHPRQLVDSPHPQNRIYYLHEKREGPRRRKIWFGGKP